MDFDRLFLTSKITFKKEYNNGKFILGISTNENNIQLLYRNNKKALLKWNN
jgi:hypothetical protein